MVKSTKYRRSSRRHASQPKSTILVVLLAGVAMLVLALLAWRNAAAPKAEIQVTGEPRLVVDQEMIDFGDVQFEVPVQASFQITNVGDQPLRFTKQPAIQVAAGC
jgi:hypothetical protein